MQLIKSKMADLISQVFGIFLLIFANIFAASAQTAIFHHMLPSTGTPYNRCIRINITLYPGNLTRSDPKEPNVLHPIWSPAFEMFFLNDAGSAQAGGGTSMTWVKYPIITKPILTSGGCSSQHKISACAFERKTDSFKLFVDGLLNGSTPLECKNYRNSIVGGAGYSFNYNYFTNSFA
jgi:hypothetical protein